MKFISKKDHDILEVLHYNEGPCLYGFEQKGESFLACLKKQNNDDSQTWILVPLTQDDKYNYELMKSNKLSLSDFIKDKGAWEVTFDYTGLNTKENWLPKVDTSKVPSYSLTY